MSDEWKVHPHGPLTRVADGVWMIDAPLPYGIPRRCVFARREDDSLVVHSAIAADEKTMAEIDALGPVKWIVVPSRLHRIDGPRFKARYPDAKVVAPRAAVAKVEERVKVEVTYDAFPSDARVRIEHLDGVGEQEGYMLIAGSDGATLVLNDAMFNLKSIPGAFGFVYGRLLRNAGRPKVTTIARMFLVKDRRAFRAHLERLADVPDLRRILVAHGDPIVTHAAETLRRVAAAL